MTNRQYGYWLATIWGAVPGVIGAIGVWSGISQGRIAPVIVGIIFLGCGCVMGRILMKAALKRND